MLELFYIYSEIVLSGDPLMESQEGIKYYLILCCRSLQSGFRRALPTAMQIHVEPSLPSANTSLSTDQSYVARLCASLLAFHSDLVRHHCLCYLPTYHLPSGKPLFSSQLQDAWQLARTRCQPLSASIWCEIKRDQTRSRGCSNHQSSSTWKISRCSKLVIVRSE